MEEEDYALYMHTGGDGDEYDLDVNEDELELMREMEANLPYTYSDIGGNSGVGSTKKLLHFSQV
jgi:hypothetical protein